LQIANAHGQVAARAQKLEMSAKQNAITEPHGHSPEVETLEIIEVIDIEEHSKTHGGKKPPKAHRYKIRVDREKFTVEVPGMKGRDILTLAGKTPPEKFLLNQKFHHGQVAAVGLDDYVDFTAPGVERFITLPRDQTDGREASRQHFKLPEDDVLHLQATGNNWETIPENWLVVHGFPVPDGYNVRQASVAIRIPANYPTAALDMAYFHPALQLASGRPIPNVTANQPIDGRSWQQWSRHYTPQHPWLAGEYSVTTHLALVRSWLDRELTRN
jgi:hypothetical protein